VQSTEAAQHLPRAESRGSSDLDERVRPRAARGVLFVLLFASYAYFYQAGGWNQNSRFAVVRAIAQERVLCIDRFADSTGDKAFFRGHYYSDKAPGLALSAVPIVALARPAVRALGGDPDSTSGVLLLSYLATLLTVGLVAAVAGPCLYSIAVELGARPAAAAFAALTFGLGTPTWTLATLFMGHAFSAALLVVGFAAALRVGAGVGRSPWADVRSGALVGACGGWATVTEFPAVVPAAAIALLAAASAWPLGPRRAARVLGALSATALACAVVLLTYQYLCFGSPLHFGYDSVLGYARMREGFFGLGMPGMRRLGRILFGDHRGLLPLAPALAVAPVGLGLMTLGSSRARRAAVVAAVVAAYYLLLNASYAYWDGGWSFGPRHASPAIPFLCLGLAALWTRLPGIGRWMLAVVAIYGLAVTLVAVSTMAQPPAEIRRPIPEFLWPAFRDGDLSLNTQSFAAGTVPDKDFRTHSAPRVAFNLGMKVGLDGLASLTPLLAVWAGGAAMLGAALRSRPPRSHSRTPPLRAPRS